MERSRRNRWASYAEIGTALAILRHRKSVGSMKHRCYSRRRDYRLTQEQSRWPIAQILMGRERIKRVAIQNRRLQHQMNAA